MHMNMSVRTENGQNTEHCKQVSENNTDNQMVHAPHIP